jgi:hypothetical protein
MNDKQGREYARYSQLKRGDAVQIDAGFDCMPANSVLTVEAWPDGTLFIECDHGSHDLEGQLDIDDGDSLIGIYRVAG